MLVGVVLEQPWWVVVLWSTTPLLLVDSVHLLSVGSPLREHELDLWNHLSWLTPLVLSSYLGFSRQTLGLLVQTCVVCMRGSSWLSRLCPERSIQKRTVRRVSFGRCSDEILHLHSLSTLVAALWSHCRGIYLLHLALCPVHVEPVNILVPLLVHSPSLRLHSVLPRDWFRGFHEQDKPWYVWYTEWLSPHDLCPSVLPREWYQIRSVESS